jgi:hypothetical protein
VLTAQRSRSLVRCQLRRHYGLGRDEVLTDASLAPTRHRPSTRCRRQGLELAIAGAERHAEPAVVPPSRFAASAKPASWLPRSGVSGDALRLVVAVDFPQADDVGFESGDHRWDASEVEPTVDSDP